MGPMLYTICYYFGVQYYEHEPLACLLIDEEARFTMKNLAAMCFSSPKWKFAFPYKTDSNGKRFDFESNTVDFSHIA